jgi:hypothetical protein
MRKAILMILLAVVSTNTMAEWTQIGDDVVKTGGIDSGRGVKTFVRADIAGKHGARVTMWTIRDYESPVTVENKKHFSSMSLEEYDCKDMRYKTLTFYWYSKHQAKGDIVYSDISPADMQPIILDSLAHTAWKIACGK